MKDDSYSLDLILPIIIGSIILLLLSVFIISFVFKYRQAQLNMILERQNLQHAKLKAEVEIREYTLNYVSKELHDNLGQIASVLKINLTLIARENIHSSPRLYESQDLIQKLINEIKSVSKSLNSGNVLKIGLTKALENDIARVNKTGVLSIKFNAPGELPMLTKETELLLYRMCQEALNNILQHSKATCGFINFINNQHKLHIQIIDNGVGFDVQKVENNSLGLANFKERCKFIGADYSLFSNPGHGTRIEIILPIKNHSYDTN